MAWIAAIVALVLLIMFPKRMAIFIAVSFIVVGGILGFSLYNEHQRREDYLELRSSVIVSVVPDLDRCTEGYPLLMSIKNQSRETVTKVDWNVAAHVPGYSSNLVDILYDRYSSDKIMQPQQQVSFCYAVPKLSKSHPIESLNWTADVRYVETSKP